MVRSLRLTAFALALSAVPAVVSAQGDKPLSFGASGGLSLPMGDTGDAFNTGFNISGHVFYKLANQPKLTLRGDVTFDRFGADSESFGDFDSDVNFRSLGFIGNVMYSLTEGGEGSMPIYLIGGLGFYNGEVSSSVDLPSGGSVSVDGSSTDIGFNVGAGVNFKLSGFTTFLEARYHYIDGGGFLPVTFGVRF